MMPTLHQLNTVVTNLTDILKGLETVLMQHPELVPVLQEYASTINVEGYARWQCINWLHDVQFKIDCAARDRGETVPSKCNHDYPWYWSDNAATYICSRCDEPIDLAHIVQVDTLQEDMKTE